MKKICTFLATGFNVGYLKGAPGTYGTVVGVALYFIFSSLPLISYIVFATAFVFLSVWITRGALSSFESEDPSEVVIDEIAGFFVTMIGHSAGLLTVGLGFIFFRFFDIVKPWPVRLIDRKLKGPWGIVLDDVAAGVYACLLLFVVRWVFGI